MKAIFHSRPWVFEKDIDAVLASRFQADLSFAHAFVSNVALQTGKMKQLLQFDAITVERQAQHAGATGTIDLLLHLWFAGRECGRILLENKIDSGFTPDQPERYATSAAAMSMVSRPALAVLCAPAGYLGRSRLTEPFHARVSYEAVAEWMIDGDRSTILDAISRFQMPYEPDPVPEVTGFFEGYRELARRHTPELIVKPCPNAGNGRPSGSHTIYFDVGRTLPSYDFLPALRFSHQCQDKAAPSASVKIMIAGWGTHEKTLHRQAADTLGNTSIYIRAAKKSLGLVIDTPRLDNRQSVSQQAEKVLTGLRAAATLCAWMFENHATLRHWRDATTR